MNAQQAGEIQQEAMQLKEEKIKWQIENGWTKTIFGKVVQGEFNGEIRQL